MLRVDNISVSIHPPRVGRDASVRVLNGILYDVSIHPPRVGGDQNPSNRSGIQSDFNPPSPCGEGPGASNKAVSTWEFQSTLPVWGGTWRRFELCVEGKEFQSTLPVWGGTRTSTPIPSRGLFQSTLPVWGGTSTFFTAMTRRFYFNPPSPCGEGQQKLTKILCKLLR